LLGEHLSQLATAKLESEKSEIRSWIRNGISRSLAQLEAETITGITTANFKGVVTASVTKVWERMAEYIKHTCYYFGFAHLAVLSCDYWNSDGTITLLSHHGRSFKEFPFPKQYDCTEWYASLQTLSSDMAAWRTATAVDLERYASLPVIKPLHESVHHHRSASTYAISCQFVTGISPILVLGTLDYRKRSMPLSQYELDEFTEIGTGIGLVANICNLVNKLDEATERQARFIEDVAHDIRNPIQNLMSMAEYMQIESLPIEAKQKTAKNIEAEVKRINDLGRRVWLLEDLRRGVLDPKQRSLVSIFEVIMRCQKSLHHREVQQEITFAVDKELQKWPGVQLNEDLFYHAVLNLMDNAVKYSSPNTEVRVSGELRPLEYVLTFGNIGIGVPDDEKELIFKRNYRAKNAQIKVREGTGIGLSIVKAFADYYGSIEVESVPLERSSQYITIFRLKIRRE
jgi:signal transduction histidine kinase